MESTPAASYLASWLQGSWAEAARTEPMTAQKNGTVAFSRFGDETDSRVCSIIWQEVFYERQYFSRDSRENSRGQELRNNDRVYSVRVPRG